MLFISHESKMEVQTVDREPNEEQCSSMTTKSTTIPMTSSLKDNIGISSSVSQMDDDLLNLNDNDVLCGRGSVIHKHTGNRRFRRLISANKADYASCEKNSHKYFLALSIVLAIERQGGRFVKRSDEKIEDSSLVVLSRKDAVAKTAQALRDQLHRGGGGSGDSHSRCRSKSTSPIVAAKKQSKAYQESEGMDDGSGDNEKIHAESCSDDFSQEESSNDWSSNDSSSSNHSNAMDCDTSFPQSAPMFTIMAAPTTMMFPFPNFQTMYHSQPFSLPSMVGHYPTPMRDPSSNPGQNGVAGFHSAAPGHENLWIPAELEALMHEDPNVAWALSSLE